MKRVLWLASVAFSLSVCACGGAGGPISTTGQDLTGSRHDDGGAEPAEPDGEAHGGGGNQGEGKDDRDADVDNDERDGEVHHGDHDAGHEVGEHDGDVDHELGEHDGDVDHEHGDTPDSGHGGPGPH
jgi:hypothetical protein